MTCCFYSEHIFITLRTCVAGYHRKANPGTNLVFICIWGGALFAVIRKWNWIIAQRSEHKRYWKNLNLYHILSGGYGAGNYHHNTESAGKSSHRSFLGQASLQDPKRYYEVNLPDLLYYVLCWIIRKWMSTSKMLTFWILNSAVWPRHLSQISQMASEPRPTRQVLMGRSCTVFVVSCCLLYHLLTFLLPFLYYRADYSDSALRKYARGLRGIPFALRVFRTTWHSEIHRCHLYSFTFSQHPSNYHTISFFLSLQLFICVRIVYIHSLQRQKKFTTIKHLHVQLGVWRSIAVWTCKSCKHEPKKRPGKSAG